MNKEDMNVGETLLELFDEIHDAIHVFRQMSAVYLDKAETLESSLAQVLRLDLVQISELKPLPDNVIPFPVSTGDFSDV